MGTKRTPDIHDAYARALPDEPLFTLVGRDRSAPGMVRQWAYERERAIATGDAPQSDHVLVAAARQIALDMEHWRERNDGAWRPSFTCPFCARISHNPHDVRERYCASCHVFVDDEQSVRAFQTRQGGGPLPADGPLPAAGQPPPDAAE